MQEAGLLFLLLNASVVWAVIAGLITWLIRSKLFVLVLLIAPYIIGSAFRSTPGMQPLLGMYSTSLIYGSPGIIFGVLYADYQRVKQYLVRASKLAFLARGGIALSSTYLLGYFGQKIIFENPALQFFLGFIDGGDRAKELISHVDQDGAITSGIVIAGSFALLGLTRILEHRRSLKDAQKHKSLETL